MDQPPGRNDARPAGARGLCRPGALVRADSPRRPRARHGEEMRAFRPRASSTASTAWSRADGRSAWVWEQDAIVRDADGRRCPHQGVMVDITERREASCAERDRAQHYLDVAGHDPARARHRPDRRAAQPRTGASCSATRTASCSGRTGSTPSCPRRTAEARARQPIARSWPARATSRAPPRGRRHHADRRAPHDRLAQRAAARRRRAASTGDPGLGRGRHRAPRGRGADRPPRLLRPADRPAQPRAARRAPSCALARARRAGRAVALLLRRPRQLQARQRLASATAPATGCCGGSPGGCGASSASSDLLARQGGDEFLLLLADLARRRRGGRPRRGRARGGCGLGRAVLGRRRRSSTSARAIGISCSPRRRTAPRSCCSTPTWRCTRQRPRPRRLDRLRRRGHEPLERLSLSARLRRAIDARRARPALPADRRAADRARCARWRRCCAGTTPSAGSSRPTSSSPSPRRWA